MFSSTPSLKHLLAAFYHQSRRSQRRRTTHYATFQDGNINARRHNKYEFHRQFRRYYTRLWSLLWVPEHAHPPDNSTSFTLLSLFPSARKCNQRRNELSLIKWKPTDSHPHSPTHSAPPSVPSRPQPNAHGKYTPEKERQRGLFFWPSANPSSFYLTKDQLFIIITLFYEYHPLKKPIFFRFVVGFGDFLSLSPSLDLGRGNTKEIPHLT